MLMKIPFIIICIITSALTVRAQDFTRVIILVPRFQTPKGKPDDVGARAASILGLQIWRTYSTPTLNKPAFDNADFLFDLESHPKTYAEAESLARSQRKNAHLVLWGKASKYGEGIVVESNLLVRKGVDKSKSGTSIWSVTILAGKKRHTVSVDIPAWQYEFAPIVLNPALISQFEKDSRELALKPNSYLRSSHNLALGIYSMRSTNSDLKGVLGEISIYAIRHEGDWSFVSVGGTGTGWLYLPQLSQNPSEVVSFCSGIIRILRGDLPGAVSIFQEVLENSSPPTAIKIDSYLYMAIAYDKMHDEAKSFSMIAEAYKLNPYSKVTTQYLCMSYLAKLARLLPRDAGGAEAKKTIRSIQEVLSNNKVLFAEGDPWVTQVEQVLTELMSRDGEASYEEPVYTRQRLLHSP